jgi:hypothetical protein
VRGERESSMRVRVAKRYVKVKLEEQESDYDYWQSQPYTVRLAALEQLRQEYHRWRYDAEPRLQRVYRSVKQ